jgi:hypothetical protein
MPQKRDKYEASTIITTVCSASDCQWVTELSETHCSLCKADSRRGKQVRIHNVSLGGGGLTVRLYISCFMLKVMLQKSCHKHNITVSNCTYIHIYITTCSVTQSQCHIFFLFFLTARHPLGGLGRLIFPGFTITLFRHTTLGRTPLYEWSAHRRDFYLTTHNTHNRQTSMPSSGFEPAIPASEWPQTDALDRTATAIDVLSTWFFNFINLFFKILKSHQPISVADFILRVNHVKILIS